MSAVPMDDGKMSANVPDDLSTCRDKSIERIYNRAKSQGLRPSEIMKLITRIESKQVDNEIKLQIMKCLIPQETVPEDAFIRMTCLLCNFKFPCELKVEILKWMISVYYFMETPASKFQLLYEIFFTLIDQEKLRPYVCHFMFLITRKEMVTERRVRSLIKLLYKYEKEPCFIFILRSYYMLGSEFFDVEINDDFEYEFESLGIYPSLIQCVHPSYEFHASSFQHVTSQDSSNIKILSESSAPAEKSSNLVSFNLDPFQETYQEFKALEVSTNISKIIKSRLRRMFITSDLPLKTKIKFDDYILTLYYQNLDSPEFLEAILETFHEMRDTFPDASDFTDALVSSYSSNVNLLAGIIAEILLYEPISCFEKIRYKMDLIREQLLKCTSASLKCQLLNCLSKIYQNWVSMEHNDSTAAVIPCDGRCSASDDSSSTTEQAHLTSDEIYKLCSYIDDICDALILDDDLHSCLLNEILLHYERVSTAHSRASKILDIHFLTRPVFQLALFSLSACTLDNLALLLLRYDYEIRRMQKEHHSEYDVAARSIKLYKRDLQKILLDGSYKRSNSTCLTKAGDIWRLKERCPHFEIYFALHRHPALLLKTMAYIDQNQLSNFPSDPDSLSLFQHIAGGICKYVVKLVTLLVSSSS